MEKRIGIKWHKAYVVILLIRGFLLILSLLGEIFLHFDNRKYYYYSNNSYDLLFIGLCVLDAIRIYLNFHTRNALKDFAVGAVGTHTLFLIVELILVGLRMGLESYDAITKSISWFRVITGVAGGLILAIPLFIYYRKRAILFEAPAAVRENLIYGTPLPEYVPRTLPQDQYGKQTAAAQTVKTEEAPAEQPVQQPAEQPQEQPQAQPEAKREKAVFCYRCGKKLMEDAAFCAFCGTKVPE